MPPSRRLPRAVQPSRRPRVAGLRKPAGSPDPEAPAEQQAEPPAEQGAPAEPIESTAPTESAVEPEAPETPPESPEEPEQAAPAPGPRRKARDQGRPKPVSEDEVVVAEPEPDFSAYPAPPKRGWSGKRGWVLVTLLLVFALAFGGLAVLFKVRHSEVSAATGNAALIDVAGTAQVKQAMSGAAERLFSIDYNDIGKTERAADELLVNDEVRGTYDTLMQDVRKRAPQQKIVVTVKATRSAVVALNGDRARVMVYIDQTATRTTDNQTSSGSAALWFNTEKRDGQWKVTAMDTYSSGQPTPAPSTSSTAPSTPGS